MTKHWTKYRFQNASQVIAEKSGWSIDTIRRLRTKLKLPDNRLKHDNKTKPNR
jgi:hypothetical protein